MLVYKCGNTIMYPQKGWSLMNSGTSSSCDHEEQHPQAASAEGREHFIQTEGGSGKPATLYVSLQFNFICISPNHNRSTSKSSQCSRENVKLPSSTRKPWRGTNQVLVLKSTNQLFCDSSYVPMFLGLVWNCFAS